MQEIIFIGTIHGFTPIKDLKDIFEKYKPKQIFVEICQGDIDRNKISQYPKEMIEAYNWAKKNKIKVKGFDFSANVLVKRKTDEDNKKLIERQEKIVKKYDWKKFNKSKFLELLNKNEDNIVDKDKFRLRQEKMFENIKKNLTETEITIIMTGAGHLTFFESKFPHAIFPLRDYMTGYPRWTN